jgi:uncharacterized membrane protein
LAGWLSGFGGLILENYLMRTRIFLVCSQVAELSVFFAAAAVLAVGLMGVR